MELRSHMSNGVTIKKKCKRFVQQAVGVSTLTPPSSQYADDGCTPVFPITRSHSKLETTKISLLLWQFAMLTDSTFLAFGVMCEDCEQSLLLVLNSLFLLFI